MAKVPTVQINSRELAEMQKALKVATRLVSKLSKNFKLTKKEWSDLEAAGYDFKVLSYNIPLDIH
jgi:hypothetical protein